MRNLCALLASFLLAHSVVAEDSESIGIDELEELIRSEEVILLDMNGSTYFAKGHLPGAIDFRAHEESLAEVLGPDKDRLVVVYCGSPSCDAYLAGVTAAKAEGFTRVKHFPGGISGWIAAGKETGRSDR